MQKTARQAVLDWFNEVGESHTEEQATDAILAALSAAGFAVVPREPTHKMLIAGEDEAVTGAIWAAMLSAAEPPL
jgi:predicted CoA-binding protein